MSCSRNFDEVKHPDFEYIQGRNSDRELDVPHDHLVPTNWQGYPYRKGLGSSLMQFEYPSSWGPAPMYGWELFLHGDQSIIILYWDEKELKKVEINNITWVDELYEFWVNMLYQVRYPKFRDKTGEISFDGRTPPYFACRAPQGDNNINDLYFRGTSPIQGGDSSPAIMIRSAEFVFECAGSGAINNKDFKNRLLKVLQGASDDEYWKLKMKIEENINSNKTSERNAEHAPRAQHPSS